MATSACMAEPLLRQDVLLQDGRHDSACLHLLDGDALVVPFLPMVHASCNHVPYHTLLPSFVCTPGAVRQLQQLTLCQAGPDVG
jgi:hypothetical protein